MAYIDCSPSRSRTPPPLPSRSPSPWRYEQFSPAEKSRSRPSLSPSNVCTVRTSGPTPPWKKIESSGMKTAPWERNHKESSQEPAAPWKQKESRERDLNSDLDWECPDCRYINFARREVCQKCKRPWDGNSEPHEAWPREWKDDGDWGGDWECSACGHSNFARRGICQKCGSPKNSNLKQQESGNQGRNRRGHSERRVSGNRSRERSRRLDRGEIGNHKRDRSGHLERRESSNRSRDRSRPSIGHHRRDRSGHLERRESRAPGRDRSGHLLERRECRVQGRDRSGQLRRQECGSRSRDRSRHMERRKRGRSRSGHSERRESRTRGRDRSGQLNRRGGGNRTRDRSGRLERPKSGNRSRDRSRPLERQERGTPSERHDKRAGDSSLEQKESAVPCKKGEQNVETSIAEDIIRTPEASTAHVGVTAGEPEMAPAFLDHIKKMVDNIKAKTTTKKVPIIQMHTPSNVAAEVDGIETNGGEKVVALDSVRPTCDAEVDGNIQKDVGLETNGGEKVVASDSVCPTCDAEVDGNIQKEVEREVNSGANIVASDTARPTRDDRIQFFERFKMDPAQRHRLEAQRQKILKYQEHQQQLLEGKPWDCVHCGQVNAECRIQCFQCSKLGTTKFEI